VEQTFISHLLELRNRLVRCAIAWVIALVVLFPFANDLYTLLAQPLLAKLPKGSQLIATGVTATFFIPMKVALMTSFLAVLPFILYQVWAFVAPGLYAHERRFAIPVVVTSTLLFFVGMAFAYFLVFPVVFGFLAGTTPSSVTYMPDIGNYLDLVITLFIAFGITFEVPIVVVLLIKMGWVTPAKLREARGYVIVGAFVIGAIFTPPDVISQFMLAMPLWLLYELGIIIGSFVSRPSKEEPYQPLSEADMEAELDRIETEQKRQD